MSGTSVDSVDAALVKFKKNKPTIVSTYSLPIAKELRLSVHKLAISGKDEIAQLRYLDKEFALLSCNAIQQLCQQANCPPTSITAVGSHGQTIRHYPNNKHNVGYSLQVGDPNIIAEKTGITTVADFRRRDIAAGGQGAPLTPAFHQNVFHSTLCDRIILNTGGIANITWLPKTGNVTGYDTGPANGLMDSWCQQHQQSPFDNGGEWAKSGKVNTQLLTHLLQHPYFALSAPKSTGREDFNIPWLDQQLVSFPQTLQAEDVQATLLALTVESISQQIEKRDSHSSAEIYVCGGGAHNIALMQSLAQRLQPRRILSTESLGIHPDWVEATAFAWLAKQNMEKAAGNLPSVTGADREVVLGGIYFGG
ncbi:MAG: anhydro-N-acetylmuramic acid kinase [Kiritimatiellia bacterium]|jgi:anhydro-N-acetylmuramic acid kinase